MTTELQKITWHDDGNLDVGKLIENIETVRDVADETERLRVSALEDLASIYPPSVSCVIEERGDYTALGKTYRAEMRLTQVFLVAGTTGDDGLDAQVLLLKNGAEALCEPLTLKASEGRGKVVVADVLSYPTITRFDEITIRSDSDRRMVVTMNFGGV